MTAATILDYYRQPAPMSAPGAQGEAVRALGDDVSALASAIQGLYIHEHIAGAYGETITDERRGVVHLRRGEARLACARGSDARPLAEARPPGARLVANCRHFSVFLVGALREQGIAARSRCGFGMYFESGRGVDHWVAEYWDTRRGRWVLADAQIDDVQRGLFQLGFDTLDVPRDRFLVAGEAWRRCRMGEADPSTFGILDMTGYWFIAGNIVRDVAALNGMEMLPWDAWGAMPQPNEEIDAEGLRLFDRLADITIDPDAHFAELRELYESDDRLHVPGEVLNVITGQMEPV